LIKDEFGIFYEILIPLILIIVGIWVRGFGEKNFAEPRSLDFHPMNLIDKEFNDQPTWMKDEVNLY